MGDVVATAARFSIARGEAGLEPVEEPGGLVPVPIVGFLIWRDTGGRAAHVVFSAAHNRVWRFEVNKRNLIESS
jgi:hypothetical protein